MNTIMFAIIPPLSIKKGFLQKEKVSKEAQNTF